MKNMRTILVDDEKIMLRQLETELLDNPRVTVVGSFTLSTKALEYAEEHPVDFALLDIEMPSISGIELGKKLRKIRKDMVIIYVTGFSEYMKQAFFDVKADYYLLKPYNARDVAEAVERAELLSMRQKKSVYAQTFGRFEVFYSGMPVEFKNAKAKELFALCVDHQGGEVTLEECVDKLWSDRPFDDRVKNLYRKAVSYLNRRFAELGCEEVFVSRRGSCRINPGSLESDYLHLVQEQSGDIAPKVFEGEYMIDYLWGRETEARLTARYGALL